MKKHVKKKIAKGLRKSSKKPTTGIALEQVVPVAVEFPDGSITAAYAIPAKLKISLSQSAAKRVQHEEDNREVMLEAGFRLTSFLMDLRDWGLESIKSCLLERKAYSSSTTFSLGSMLLTLACEHLDLPMYIKNESGESCWINSKGVKILHSL